MRNGNGKKRIEEYYSSDDYKDNYQYIEEDSAWKADKLKPFLDKFLELNSAKKLSVLDVGGGSGLALRSSAEYITTRHGRTVEQSALDLSPGFLELQRQNNPGLTATYNCSMQETPFKDKQFDLVFLIDVLEHTTSVEESLKELSRISKYVIVKVPLENNLTVMLLEMLSGYRSKRARYHDVGHINFFSFKGIKKIFNKYLGAVIKASYTDVFSYLIESDVRRAKLSNARYLYCRVARAVYKLSPGLCALIFNDFAIFLIETQASDTASSA